MEEKEVKKISKEKSDVDLSKYESHIYDDQNTCIFPLEDELNNEEQRYMNKEL